MSRCEKTETRILAWKLKTFSDRAQINKHKFEDEHLSTLLIFTQTRCTPDGASDPGRVDLDQGSLARQQNKPLGSEPCGFSEGDHLFCWCLGGVARVLPLCVADAGALAPVSRFRVAAAHCCGDTSSAAVPSRASLPGWPMPLRQIAIIPHMIDTHRPSHNTSVQCISDTHPGFRTLTAAIFFILQLFNVWFCRVSACLVRLRLHSSQVQLMTAVAVTTLV